MEDTSENAEPRNWIITAGWVISIVGSALYLYGYFAEGGIPVFDWPQILPQWAAEFVPTWQAELGFALSMLGSIPIYYHEFSKAKNPD